MNVAETEALPSWYEAALDAAPTALVVVDGELRIAFANAHAAQMLGYAPGELTHASLEAIAPEIAHPPEPGRVELVGTRKSGERLPIELAFGAMVTAGRRIVAIRDLTEQNHAEALQREATDARARLEAMLEFAPAFIIGVSNHGTIDFINRTLPQYTRQDVIGSDWLSYFAPDLTPIMVHKRQQAYDTDTTQYFETTTAGPDGRALWFDSQLALIRSGGVVAGTVLVSQDVTLRKREQAELQAGRHMALLGTLAAGVAHEINTPIQFVSDSVEFLRNAGQDLLSLLFQLDKLRREAGAGGEIGPIVAAAAEAERQVDLEYLRDNMPAAFDRCVAGLNQISRIVRSLKDFAHPSESEAVLADVNRAVESALTIARNEYKFVAELETDLGDLPRIPCHAAELSQVVLNIVVNAAHAIGDVVRGTDHKGLISVATRYEGGAVRIAIRDTGGGIPKAIQARIFDPFFTTKDVGKGTGQGLAIAWSIVKERHGGELTFATEPGKGTTFVIRIPDTHAT